MIDAVTFATDQDFVVGPSGGSKTIGGAHSIASDPVTNQYYFPVPAQFFPGIGPTLCGSHGGDDLKGCILVLTSPGRATIEFSSLLGAGHSGGFGGKKRAECAEAGLPVKLRVQ